MGARNEEMVESPRDRANLTQENAGGLTSVSWQLVPSRASGTNNSRSSSWSLADEMHLGGRTALYSMR